MVCRAARNDGRVLDVSRVLAGALLFAGTVVVAYVLLSLLDGTAHASTVGSAVAPGARLAGPFSHYSILRTIEAMWGLPPLRQAGCSCTEVMTAFFAAA